MGLDQGCQHALPFLQEAVSAGKTPPQLPGLTTEARRYAVKELARRAGVTREFFLTWKIEVLEDRTTVSLGSAAHKTIHFLHARRESFERQINETIPVAKAGWLYPRSNGTGEPDLILPFCLNDSGHRAPLYQIATDGSMVCRADLLSSLVLTLCRAEESTSTNRDQHGRFLASGSVSFQQNFLERPILDEHGLAFEQVLSSLLPSWRPRSRALRLKLSHDIDQVGMPFQLGTSIGHTLRRRSVSATIRDFSALLTGIEPVELSLVRRLAAVSSARGLHSAFYWKAGEASAWDTGYDPLESKVLSVIRFVEGCGYELGVHPGYNTFGDRDYLSSEVKQLAKALRVNSPGGRQHYLRWTPGTWLDWEACGLKYDSSVGFAEHFGFRAGTAFPYRPWSLEENRELCLIEIPLVLMDVTPVKYMKLRHHEGLERIRGIVQRTARVGGVFSLLWHNTSLLDPEFNGWYESILEMLSTAEKFDLPERPDLLW